MQASYPSRLGCGGRDLPFCDHGPCRQRQRTDVIVCPGHTLLARAGSGLGLNGGESRHHSGRSVDRWGELAAPVVRGADDPSLTRKRGDRGPVAVRLRRATSTA